MNSVENLHFLGKASPDPLGLLRSRLSESQIREMMERQYALWFGRFSTPKHHTSKPPTSTLSKAHRIDSLRRVYSLTDRGEGEGASGSGSGKGSAVNVGWDTTSRKSSTRTLGSGIGEKEVVEGEEEEAGREEWEQEAEDLVDWSASL
ncbi:hypothetical protein HK104_005363 [Borealophlyctis nickersoniae]|nr:hypothetical protein HK104_005363 [Borealophlyctis nickersoniae]